LESELKLSEYLAVCILGTVLAMVIGWTLIVALLNEFWGLAAVVAIVTFGPPAMLGMAFHARRLRPAAPSAGRTGK